MPNANWSDEQQDRSLILWFPRENSEDNGGARSLKHGEEAFRTRNLASLCWNASRVRSKSLFTGTLRLSYASCFPPHVAFLFEEKRQRSEFTSDSFTIFLRFQRSSLIIRFFVLLLPTSFNDFYRYFLLSDDTAFLNRCRKRKIENLPISFLLIFWWKCWNTSLFYLLTCTE